MINPSEDYRKYLTGVLLNGQLYYTIWGTDMSNNEEDKVIVDSENKHLLFKEKKALYEYLRNADDLFDADNFNRWLKETGPDLGVYAVMNIDCMKNIPDSQPDKERYKDIIDTRNFISDYAIQVDHPQLRPLIDHQDAIDMFFGYMDQHFWSATEEEPTKVKWPEVQQLLNQAFDVYAGLVTIK